MGSQNQVSVEITLQERAATQSLKLLTDQIQKTEYGFKKMGTEGDKSLSTVDKATQGAAMGFKSLVAGVTIANLASTAIIGTAMAVKEFVAGSVNAAIEQENAINRLNQALKASGDFTTAASEDLLTFATSMQKVSVFGDEVVIGQLAVAKSFGATNEQARQLVQAAANLSATFGGSLESNVEKLGKTFSGEAGRLAQYIPELKKLTTEQLEAGAAFEIVNKKYDGAAANELATYQGGITSLSNAYSDLQEELGGFVTGSAAVGSIMGTVKTLFERATQALIDYRTEQARGENGFQETQESVNQLSREYENLTGKIEELEKRGKSLPGGLDAFDTSKIKIFRNELAVLEQQIKNAQTEVFVQDRQAEKLAGPDKAKGSSAADDARVLKEQEVQVLIAGIKEQARIAEEEQRAITGEIGLANKDAEIQALYEFEALKLEAVFAAEEAKANLIKNKSEQNLKLQEINARRELEFTKLSVAQQKAENAKKVTDQQANNDKLMAVTSSMIAQGISLAKEGSAEQKVLQIAQATMSTYTAAANALTIMPPPVGIALASIVTAMGLANVAKISGAKFEQGGIVGGNSMTGDTISARVNSGEMILNRQQQTSLFNQINSGPQSNGNSDQIERLITAINNQTVIVKVDEREIARSVRSQVQNGFKIA